MRLLLMMTVVLSSGWSLHADIRLESEVLEAGLPPRGPGTGMLPLLNMGGILNCSRRTKPIAKATLHMSQPLASVDLMAKLKEFNDVARKNGADALLAGSFEVDEYSESGYAKKGRFTMTAVRFTDEPKVDRRSETQFREALLQKRQLHRLEGIWLDPISRERTAILEVDGRPGEFVGVQFDPAGSPDVPAGLVTLRLFQKPDGTISGRVTRDDYVEFNVRASVSSAGSLSLRSYQCTNWFTPAELSEKVVPIYEAIEFKFELMPLGDGRGSK